MASRNGIHYLSAVSQLKTRLLRDVPNLRAFFSSVLDPTPKSPLASQTYQMVDAAFSQLCPGRPSQGIDSKALFNDYLARAKSTFTPDQYVAFLRFLSLYVARKISHEMFIRMCLKLFPPDQRLTAPLVQLLPSFLSALHCGSFSRLSLMNLPRCVQEKLGAEALLSITAGIGSTAIARTVSKCLNCLATGLLSPSVARPWLLRFCRPDLVAKMDEISNFTFLHPSRFPHELILCPEFIDRDPATSVCQQFVDAIAARRAFTNFVPVSRELLLTKLRGLRRAIRHLAAGRRPDLHFVYARQSARIAAELPLCAPVVIGRLWRHYETTRDLLEKIYSDRMSGLSPGDPEFRFWFRQSIRRDFLCFPYMAPGPPRRIAFRIGADVAIALVRDFALAYFDAPERTSVLSGLDAIAPLFESTGRIFMVGEAVIAVVVYLSVLTAAIADSGDLQGVVVAGGSLRRVAQRSEFAERLARLPGVLRTREVALGEHFGDVMVQHTDLIIARCVRALNAVAAGRDRLREFPDFRDDELVVVAMEKFDDDGEGIAIVATALFSPCVVQFPVEEVEELEANAQ
jgi:hypothetical protein